MGRRTKIVEVVGGSVSSTNQFVAGLEERDGSGSVVSQFYAFGQKTSGSNYFYEKSGGCNNLVGLSNNSGAVITTINYGPYGTKSIVLGSFIPDFGFASYYLHQRSGLNFTHFRIYSPDLGRWLSRDPIAADSNIHGYANNNPICFTDPSGLAADPCCRYTSSMVNAWTQRLHGLADQAVSRVSNGSSSFMDWFIGAWPNTIFGNRVDREFKELVSRDRALLASDIHIRANYGEGPDIISDCADIYWEVTSKAQEQTHLDRFKGQGLSRTDLTPRIFTYVKIDRATGRIISLDW